MQIIEALEMLDPENDAHWTSEGLPLVEVVSAVLARPVKRQEITAAAPTFSRVTAPGYFEVKAESTAGAPGELFQGVEDTEPAKPAAPAPPAPPGAPPRAPAPPAKAAPPAAPPAASAAPGAQELAEDELAEEPAEDVPDVLKMSPLEVLRSAELTALAFATIEGQIADLTRTKRGIEDEIKRLAGMSDVLSRLKDRLHKPDPNASMQGIRDYLDRSKVARAERVESARRFIASGTTARDVAEQLQGASKIDAAMARRTQRGTQRPSVPPMGQPPKG